MSPFSNPKLSKKVCLKKINSLFQWVMMIQTNITLLMHMIIMIIMMMMMTKTTIMNIQ